MDNGKLMAALAGGVVAAVISGSITYFSTKKSIEMQVVYDQKALSYAQFVSNRTRRDELIKNSADEKLSEEMSIDLLAASTSTIAARKMIAVFGDVPVVEALVEQRSSGGGDYRANSVDTYNAMRVGLGGEMIEEVILEKFLFPGDRNK